MALRKIISDAQTGVGRVALDVAIKMDISHGVWILKDRPTEDSVLPEKYHLDEMPTISYPKCAEQNVIDSDGTVIFSYDQLTGRSVYTREMAIKHNRHWLHVDLAKHTHSQAAQSIGDWLRQNNIVFLNVAGPRASKSPDIYDAVAAILGAVCNIQMEETSMQELPQTATPLTVEVPVDQPIGHQSRVTEGNTLKVVVIGGKVLTVRLVGIDLPENKWGEIKVGQPYFLRVTKYLDSLLLNKEVTLKDYGVDSSGHRLAEVYVGGRNLNLEMVKAGCAEVFRETPVSGFDIAQYQNAEAKARDQRRGMWKRGSGDYGPLNLRESLFGLVNLVLPKPTEPEPAPPNYKTDQQVIDDFLNNMDLGCIAFNVPSSMYLGDKDLFRLVLSLTKQVEELKKLIEERGEKEGAKIRISS